MPAIHAGMTESPFSVSAGEGKLMIPSFVPIEAVEPGQAADVTISNDSGRAEDEHHPSVLKYGLPCQTYHPNSRKPNRILYYTTLQY
jgi:hypothetical protein